MHIRLRLAAVVTFLVLLSGCDTADPFGETIILSTEISKDTGGSAIRFAFNSANMPTGQLVDVSCDCALDLGPYLSQQGFQRSDIVSATLVSTRLVLLFPIAERLDFLDEAILKMQASGVSVTEVASQSVFPSAREVDLVTLSGRDLAGFMDKGTFSPLLQLDATTLLPDETYSIGLVMNVRLEVQGF